MTYTNKLL